MHPHAHALSSPLLSAAGSVARELCPDPPCSPVCAPHVDDVAHLSHVHADAVLPLDGHAVAGISQATSADASVSNASADAATLSALLKMFRQRLEDPLLCLPDPKVVRRRLFQVSSASARRSRRLAAKLSHGVSSPAIKRAQVILMKKLGLSAADERLSQQQLQEYAALFASPLGPEQLRAISALFGLTAPSAVDSTTDGMETVADAA
jgi:hypothetical protein